MAYFLLSNFTSALNKIKIKTLDVAYRSNGRHAEYGAHNRYTAQEVDGYREKSTKKIKKIIMKSKTIRQGKLHMIKFITKQ